MPKDKKNKIPESIINSWNETFYNAEEYILDKDIEENTSVAELDPENMEDIYIDNEGNITDSGRNLKLFEKKWIFEDEDESMEFIGLLEKKHKVIFLDEPPKELLDILCV